MHSHITIPGSLILVTVFMQVKKYLRNPVVDFVFDLGIHLKATKKSCFSPKGLFLDHRTGDQAGKCKKTLEKGDMLL